MKGPNTHTYYGTLSLIFGIVGLISYFLLGLFFSMPLGVLAVIIGFRERKADVYANYGCILGSITVIIGVVVFITATAYEGIIV